VDPERFDITDEHDFAEHLRALLVAAEANGVDVTGGWSVDRERDRSPDWDVEVTAMAARTTHEAPDAEGFPLDAVVAAVAERSGVSETELPPLGESVDIDALERVLTDLSQTSPREVTFRYYDYTITVHAGGPIIVEG
jgi:hypothetical protein